LSVAASGAHAPTFVAGEQAVYTITVDNLGPSDNAGYSVSLGVPADTTFDSASVECAEDDGTVTCTSDGLTAAGDPQTFDVIVDITSGYVIAHDADDETVDNSAPLSATATVVSNATDDDNNTHDSDTETVGVTDLGVVGVADLEVTLSAVASGDHSETGFVAGESAVYTITVDNLGPSDNAGYKVSFGVPADTTFDSASVECAEDDGTVTCTSPGLTAAGDPQTFDVTVDITSGYVIANEANDAVPNQADLSATAALTSADTTDDNADNDSDTADVDVVGIADLEITSHVAVINDALAVNPLVSGNLNFLTAEVTVTNNGPSDAEDVTVTDTYPVDGLDPLFDEITEESEVGILTAGSSSAVLTFEADVQSTLRDGPYASTNTASVESSVTGDDVLGNSSDNQSVDVFTVPDAPLLEDAEVGNGQIGVVWARGNDTDGDADGGDDIVGYNVILTPPTGPAVVCSRNNNTPNVAGGKFSEICSGLANGTTYKVEVVARNSAGASDRSNFMNATPCAGCAVEVLVDGQRLTMITGDTVAGGNVSCEALLKQRGLGGVTDNPATPGREDIVVCDEYPANQTGGFGGLIASVREDPSVAGGVCGAQPCLGGIQYTSNVPPGVLDGAPVGTDYVREVVILDKSILGSSAFFNVYMNNGTVIGSSATSTQCHKSPPRPDLGCVERIQVLTKKDAPNGANGQGDVIVVIRFSVNPGKGITPR
jgi:uncharacterized repeat protein (TIGR01451 family)